MLANKGDKTKTKYVFTFERPIDYVRDLTSPKKKITIEVKRLVITESIYGCRYYVYLYKEGCENELYSECFLVHEKDLKHFLRNFGLDFGDKL